MNEGHLRWIPTKPRRQGSAKINTVKIRQLVAHQTDAGRVVKGTRKGEGSTRRMGRAVGGFLSQSFNLVKKSGTRRLG